MLRGQHSLWHIQGCSEVPDPTIQRAQLHQANTDLAADDAACYLATSVGPFHTQRVGRKAGDELSRQSLDILVALKTCAGNSRYLLPSRYEANDPRNGS